jgi:hypothetical protein
MHETRQNKFICKLVGVFRKLLVFLRGTTNSSCPSQISSARQTHPLKQVIGGHVKEHVQKAIDRIIGKLAPHASCSKARFPASSCCQFASEYQTIRETHFTSTFHRNREWCHPTLWMKLVVGLLIEDLRLCGAGAHTILKRKLRPHHSKWFPLRVNFSLIYKLTVLCIDHDVPIVV